MPRRFNDQFSLYQMLTLRKAGWDLKSLGVLFGVDFSTIAYWCDRFGVRPQGNLHFKVGLIIQLAPKEIPEYKKVPKSYVDYLRESMEREEARNNPNV